MKYLFIIFCSTCFAYTCAAQTGVQSNPQQAIISIALDSLRSLENNNIENGIDITNTLWRYHAGDDIAQHAVWAARDFDDTAWKLAFPYRDLDTLTEADWSGLGWFRVRIHIDSVLHGTPLALQVAHRGASDIYLDGKRIGGYGRVSADRAEEIGYRPNTDLTFFSVERVADNIHPFDHILSVRYSDTRARERFKRPVVSRSGVGFTMEFDYASHLAAIMGQRQRGQIVMMLIVGSLGILSLLHVLLFVFSRGKEHLQYSLFTGGVAMFFFSRILEGVLHNYIDFVIWGQFLQSYWLTFGFISCIAFFYSVFYARMPRLIWFFAFMPTVVFLGVSRLTFVGQQGAFLLFVAIIFVEIMRVIILAMIRKKPGAWVLGIGGFSFVSLLGLQLLKENHILNFPVDGGFFILGSFLSIPLSMSIFLSRKVAQTNNDLKSQLEEVRRLSEQAVEHERLAAEQDMQRKLLEADNERKTLELEEARKLQLSMLPQVMPNIVGLDIAMYMQTATEVGGDYYDYIIGKEGTLTLAIGDATGHGVKAGTMVAATKSLFSVMFSDDSAAGVLRPTSPALKSMNMRSMFMALAIAKIQRNPDKTYNVRISNAGMPSSLIYRAKEQAIEEILIKSMPLATMANFPYQEREVTLDSGDVLIMMSDGFPERFDIHDEILGYDVAQAVCCHIAGKNSQEVIEYCVRVSEEWSKGALLNDDMTFVVVRVE